MISPTLGSLVMLKSSEEWLNLRPEDPIQGTQSSLTLSSLSGLALGVWGGERCGQVAGVFISRDERGRCVDVFAVEQAVERSESIASLFLRSPT